MYKQLYLVALIIIALLLGRVPFLANLFSWQTTFFHEISHGLAALITGGRVLNIELRFSGSGVCYTSGGVRWLISVAGYMGAALWGSLIYLLADAIPKNRSHMTAAFLIAVLVASGLLYVRDFQSWTIIASIGIFYAVTVRFSDKLPLKLFLKLAGIYVILDALKAPMALFRHQAVSDAANLAAQTGIPQIFWITFWMATTAGCLVFIWKIERKPTEARKTIAGEPRK